MTCFVIEIKRVKEKYAAFKAEVLSVQKPKNEDFIVNKFSAVKPPIFGESMSFNDI